MDVTDATEAFPPEETPPSVELIPIKPEHLMRLAKLHAAAVTAQEMVTAATANAQAIANRYNDALYALRDAHGFTSAQEARVDFDQSVLIVDK